MSVIRDIALGGALLIVLFNLAIYTWRGLIVRALDDCDRDEPLGWIDAGWAFIKECGALAAALLLIPIGWLLPRCQSAAGTRGPVLLIHGWGLNRGAFWLLRRRLLRDGWSPVCCFDYASSTANVERAAEQLRESIQRNTDQRPLTVIGHSLGGLVLRYCVRRYPAPNVRRIITLGTPHAGTALARLPGPTRGRLASGSSFLNALNAADRVPQQFDVIAIHSSFDAMILPPQHAQYPGACNIQLNNVGHNALLFSSRVYQLIAENLAAPLK